MRRFLLPVALCFLLQLQRVHGEEAAAASEQQADDSSSHDDPSRVKRDMDMRRLSRGIQMLRLGKRSDNDEELRDLMSVLEGGYDFQDEDEEPHYRYRRSPATEPTESPDFGEVQDDSFISEDDGEAGLLQKRPMNMLRLGKRPMNMLRLGKRPMNMLRLGKRPMNMLRLGKRPMNMLRLGKRQLGMLRLGKRPMNMLRLGKRLMNDDEMVYDDLIPFDSEEDFGTPEKHQLEELQDEDEGSMYLPIDQEPEALSKRPMNMLRLGKRPMNMLRLGKRQLNMLRLGKRPMNMLRLGKRPMNMLRLGKRPMNMLRLGKREAKEERAEQ